MSSSKIAIVQNQINETTSIMKKNIEQVLNRGEKLEDLEKKTDDIRIESIEFEQTSRKLKDEMCWKKYQLQLIIIGVIITIVSLIIILIVFGSQK